MAIRLSTDMDALAQKTDETLNQLVTEVMRRLENDMDMALNPSGHGGESMRRVESHTDHFKIFERRIDELKARLEALNTAEEES